LQAAGNALAIAVQKQNHSVIDGPSKYRESDQAGERKTEKSKAKPGKNLFPH
jgi:hypothetical protein